jgi:hypothetical protein
MNERLGAGYCELSNSIGSEVVTPVVMKSNIFWDITPCSPLKANRRFGGTYCLHRYCYVSGIPWLIITGSGLDDWIYWHLHLQSLLITIDYCLRLAQFLTGLRVSSLLLWLIWFWFTNRSLHLRMTYESIRTMKNELRIWVWVLYYDRRPVCQSVLE